MLNNHFSNRDGSRFVFFVFFVILIKQLYLQAIREMQLTIILVISIVDALSYAFTFCYCGAMTAYSFSKYVDRLYETHRYNLPVQLQKHLIIIMANLQRPRFYQGFGMVVSNLTIFVNAKLNIYKNLKTFLLHCVYLFYFSRLSRRSVLFIWHLKL